jgi:hypothetical protein
MGDHSNETLQQLQSRQNDEAYARDVLLSRPALVLNKDSISWILNHVDCFVSQSRGNRFVEVVFLTPYPSFYGQDDGVWDKVGQAIGNLQALNTLRIVTLDRLDDDFYSDEDDDDDNEGPPGPIPDWEIVAQILRHVRQKVQVVINDERLRTMEELQPFARAISGHPTWIPDTLGTGQTMTIRKEFCDDATHGTRQMTRFRKQRADRFSR